MGGKAFRTRKRQRMTRRVLSFALVGCWVVTLLGAVIVIAIESAGDDRVFVFLFAVYPLIAASVAPYWIDASRNASLSNWQASLWVGAVLYLPAAGATAYWLKHAPKPGQAPLPSREEPRVSQKATDRTLSAWMIYVVVLGGAFMAYLLAGLVIDLAS